MKEKTVYAAMSADLLHQGHLNIIKKAAEYGELTLGVLSDKAISSYKRLPYQKFEIRKQIIESIKGVSNVILQEDHDYEKNLRKLKPDFVIHGDDWKTGIQSSTREKVIEVLKDWGGQLIEVPYTEGISSTMINDELIKIGISPETRRGRLRRLIQSKDMIRVLEGHNGLASIIVENVSIVKNEKKEEFDAIWSSSLTDSTSRGMPDIEAVDISTRLHTIGEICQCTTKPIIFDGDTGGKTEHFGFTVKNLEKIGVSAVIIEDKKGLKKNSLFGTDVKQEQDSIDNFCNKIKYGKNSQLSDDFMIIARIESLILGKSMEDALNRAHKYIESGADGIMIHSKQNDGKEIKRFCEEFRKSNTMIPLVVVPSSYNHVYEKELYEWGANIVIYANHLLRSAYPSMMECAKTILQNNRSLETNEMTMSIKEILHLIPGTK